MKSKKRIGWAPRQVVPRGVRLLETPEDLARAIFRDADRKMGKTTIRPPREPCCS